MKTIRLKSGRIGRYEDSSPFLVEQEKLELRIELPAKSGEFFLVTDLNGKSGGAKLIPPNGLISVAITEAGELCAAVKHYLRGELIEVFKIEPLLLREVDKGISAMPELCEIEQRSALLENAIAESNERRGKDMETLLATVNAYLHNRDLAFLAFAYATYDNSPLLNGRGLSVEAFAEALGYNIEAFTKEELEEIKNKKENF